MEATFGYSGGVMWNGNNGGGTGFSFNSIPFKATFMRIGLNIYYNTGTVPIKYSDIKVEQISGTSSLNKILIKGLH